MIDRRRFLTGSAAFGAALVTLPRSFAFNADETVITILHTNDTHSQIDPLPPNDRNAGKGGVARRATLVKRIRKVNPNTLRSRLRKLGIDWAQYRKGAAAVD